MAKQKRFIRVPGTELPLYNGLQSMIKTKREDGIIIRNLEDGSLDITPDDINFLKRNNYHSINSVGCLINSIMLFTKSAMFYDNIPITYSFCDEEEGVNSAHVLNGILHITLPMEEAEDFDPDADIIDFVLKNIPIEDELKQYLGREFKSAVYEYKYNDDRKPIVEFYRLIELTVDADNLEVVTFTVKQAFNLYLYQKNLRSRNCSLQKSIVVGDDTQPEDDEEFNSDYDDDYST